jgi:hypothetical protein
MRLLTHCIFIVSLLALSLQAQAQAPEYQTLVDCGFTPQMTAVCTTAVGTLIPGEASGNLSNVRWFDNATGETIGYGHTLHSTLPGYGEYVIGVQYSVTSGAWACQATATQRIVIQEPHCIMHAEAASAPTCPEVYAPVCGCDNQVYDNECKARLAGIKTWWAGPCSTQPPANTCGTTDMHVEVLSGSIGAGVTVQFVNQAEGNFTNMQLDYGDGNVVSIAPQATLLHTYTTMGNYQATLTAWNINDLSCISSVAKGVSTDAVSFETGSAPESVSYVLPGDANGDQKADAYDLLQLGLGYGQVGVPRPNATYDWHHQYTPNWIQHTNHGINFKHLDADGDGVIEDFDAAPIFQNYQSLDTFDMPVNPGLPTLRVDFPVDTVYIDVLQQSGTPITANLLIGSPTVPVVGMYGLAAALKYPDFIAHNPVALYDPSFFGHNNFVMSMFHDEHNRQQMDVAYVRKSGVGAVGYGRMASLDFIIIIDIIDRSITAPIPMTIDAKGVRAIDAQGNEIFLSRPTELDTLWIKLIDATSSIKQTNIDSRVQMQPNPADDLVHINTNELLVQSITMYNALGQLVLEHQPSGVSLHTIPVHQQKAGNYTVRIVTSSGVVERRLVIK